MADEGRNESWAKIYSQLAEDFEAEAGEELNMGAAFESDLKEKKEELLQAFSNLIDKHNELGDWVDQGSLEYWLFNHKSTERFEGKRFLSQQTSTALNRAVKRLILTLRLARQENPEITVRDILSSVNKTLKYCVDEGVFEGKKPKVPIGVYSEVQMAENNLRSSTESGAIMLMAKSSDVYFHPAIHVSREYSYYSFPISYGLKKSRTRFVSIDGNGCVFPTQKLSSKLFQNVSALEKRLDTLSSPSRQFPRILVQGPLDGANRTRRLIKRYSKLPFKDANQKRDFFSWCVGTYLYPALPRPRFLLVKVPDIQSARNIQTVISRICFNTLEVCRGDMATQVARHRDVLAGTAVFSPEMKEKGTKKKDNKEGKRELPGIAKEYMENLPRSEMNEPPIAIIEVTDRKKGYQPTPYLPKEWKLVIRFDAPIPVPEDLHDKGLPFQTCSLALDRDSDFMERFFATPPDGRIEYIGDMLFGKERTLQDQIVSIWKTCFQERSSAPTSVLRTVNHCSTGCLHRRLLDCYGPDILVSSQRALSLYLTEIGLKRPEHGYVRACLSGKLATEGETGRLDFRGKNVRGFVVPSRLLQK